MIQERWYQTEAIGAYLRFITSHPIGQNPCLVLPTGTGKSIIIARLVQHALQWKENKVMILTHVGELVRQNVEKIRAIWPDAPVGICSATLGRKDTEEPIIVGNMQSVYRMLKKDVRAFGRRCLLIIDECHLVSERQNSQYRQIITALQKSSPSLRICGLSATPYRTDGGLLTEQKDAVFTAIAYNLNGMFRRLIAEGFLAPVTSPKTDVQIDLSDVHVSRGEYNSDELQRAINFDVLQKACMYTLRAGADRKSWLFFVNSICNADLVEGLLKRLGITAAAVHSQKDKAENERALDAFRHQRIRALISADQLTTGFDVPGVDLIAMLRPTVSTGLFVQMVGRGTRPAPGKHDCLLLDFAHNTEKHGTIDAPLVRHKKKGGDGLVVFQGSDEGKPVRCPVCWQDIPPRARICPFCGNDLRELDLSFNVAGISVISGEQTATRHTTGEKVAVVTAMFAESSIARTSGKVFFKVDLHCMDLKKGTRFKISECLCFEHNDGFSRRKAVDMWFRLKGHYPAPKTVVEAVRRKKELQRPDRVEYGKDERKGCFRKVRRCIYSDERQSVAG